MTDTATQEKISYVYDTVGRPSETRTEKGDNIFRVLYGYDEISRPNSLTYKYNNAYTQKYSTSYIADNRITLFKLNNGQSDVFSIVPTFDTLGRQTSRTLKNGSGAQVDKEVYSFLVGAGGNNASTSVISSVSYYGADSTVDETYTYTYDDIGNIKTVSKNGVQIAAYTYNSFNMLTGYTDADGNTYTYGYSSGKNISETGKYLLFYTDDVWLDRVTCITDDASGKVFGITYDGIGNTLSYRDGMSFTWKNGRQLATFTQGQTSASYDYNENGIRNKKTVNGVTTTYQLAGSMIVSENRNGNIIQYYYNEAGSVIGLRYNGNDYFFRRTVNGDIIAILNTSGEVVVTYEYDPWGNILSTSGSMAATLGANNPFRYRGYYYDTESGLYYLQTRYYDAAVGRFINADGLTSTGQGLLGNNMYAYCLNNPISYTDPSGNVATLSCIDLTFKEGFVATYSSHHINEKRPKPNKRVEDQIKYDVPLYDQGRYRLCWAYCQVMIEDYYNGVTKTEDEAFDRAKTIAKNRHGDSDWNKGGWPENLGEERYIDNIYGLYDALKFGPCYGYYWDQEDKAHLIVVTGASILEGRVYTNNPWGIVGNQSFKEFLDGFAGDNSSMGFICIYLINN